MLKDTSLIVAVAVSGAGLLFGVTTIATTRVTVSNRGTECAEVLKTSWFGTVMHYKMMLCGEELRKVTSKRRPLHF